MGRKLYIHRLSAAFTVIMCALALSLTGCLTEGSGSEGGTTVVAGPDDVPGPPLTSPEHTICDPFNAGTSARDKGLIGNLVYLTDDQPRYSSAKDYVDNGVPVQSTLYFDKLFVPTRSWDLGFYTQAGELVLNHRDEPLYEYFGLHLESELMLAPGESPGWYQFAILSDDGATMDLRDSEGVLTPIVNNDGVHPTRMGCSMRSVYLDATSRIPFVLNYYQGPRYHISMVLMMRPLPDGVDPMAPATDAECGRSGNSRYFNYNVVPSAPTATYYDLLTRGWKPLENQNYHFPDAAENPCAPPDPLIITNFVIESTTRTSVTVSWDTNEPSTSKISIKNVSTGVAVETAEDPALVTHHVVTVPGLTANTLYAVRGISAVPGVKSSISDERAFRTPR